MSDKAVQEYIGTQEYLEHKKKRFPADDFAISGNKNEAFLLSEGLNEKGHWLPITYLPSSWCGNSYHEVALDKKEHWSFSIPVFKGMFKTRFRHSLADADKAKLFQMKS